MSENRRVPPNTRLVPAQCRGVKGLEKYQIEKRRERNFLVKKRVSIGTWITNPRIVRQS